MNRQKIFLWQVFVPAAIIAVFAVFVVAGAYSSENEPIVAARIIYPMPTRPVIVLRGSDFTAELACESAGGNWSAALSTPYGKSALEVKGAEFDAELKICRIGLSVPADVPEELYGLEISGPGGAALSARSVKVIPSYKKDYSFVHITDVHIGCCRKFDEYSKDREPEYPPEETFSKIAEEVNLLNPEFVLISGDIVTSAEGTARTRKKIEGTFAEDEFREFLEILDRFEVPTFVVPGNHDMVGTINRPAYEYWKKTFIHRYYSFRYGGAYFLGLDNSNAMEATTFLYRKGYITLDKEQRKWVIEDLNRNTASPLKVFFFHVNTNRKEIEEFADRFGPQLALFGHWHEDGVKTGGETPTTWIETRSALDFGAYRLVRVGDNRIVSHSLDEKGTSLTWNDVNVEYTPANDGTHYSVTGAVENRNPEGFDNARLKFVMPDSAGYAISGGEIVRTVPFAGGKMIFVSATIAPSGRTEITVNCE